ncbi:hypothetical protein [Phenylobacterium kunshanense]|uniref:Uncharacterized protein n=1 Tax=Phenylobacterium kunshanense TaxID=1445034 RepID=A0A328B8G4_9CAUL|nr:hypothetical protein [Phenylobacterium kunshanense]RAK63129.1 hypothetical protein DJ019_17840 [Phenylobacterium kunshanense]
MLNSTRLRPVGALLIVMSSLLATSALAQDGDEPLVGMLKAADIIALLSLTVAVVGVVLVLRQLRQQEGIMRLSAMQARYERIFEMNKYVAANPDCLKLYVNGRRYALLQKMSKEKLARLAELDLMFDHVEFQYLSSLETNPVHADSLLKAQLTNPELVAHWGSPLRGHLDRRFEAAVTRLMPAPAANPATGSGQAAAPGAHT